MSASKFVDMLEEEDGFEVAIQTLLEMSGADESQISSVTSEVQSSIEERNLDKVYLRLLPFLSACVENSEVEDASIVSVLTVLDDMFEAIGPDALPVVLKEVTEMLSSSVERSDLRVQLLMALYQQLTPSQFVHHGYGRYIVYSSLLEYTLKVSHNLPVLPTDLNVLDSYIKPQKVASGTITSSWQLSLEDQRRMHLLVAKVLLQQKREVEAYDFYLKYLYTFDNKTPAPELEKSVENAKEASIIVIRCPDLYTCDDLFEVLPVQLLGKSHGRLMELLQIMAKGSIADYDAFAGANSEWIVSTVQADLVSLRRKFQLLALCSLAEEKTTFTYADAAAALGLKDDDIEGIESAVIEAMSRSMMEARMDQFAKSISTTRVTQRVFTRNEWKKLAGQLGQWRDNITNLLGNVKKMKASHVLAQMTGAAEQPEK